MYKYILYVYNDRIYYKDNIYNNPYIYIYIIHIYLIIIF